MTNREAIEQISDAIKAYKNLYDEEIDYIKALTMAIAALEKQEPKEAGKHVTDEKNMVLPTLLCRL